MFSVGKNNVSRLTNLSFFKEETVLCLSVLFCVNVFKIEALQCMVFY